MIYYLLLIFILDYRNDIRQQIQAIFLFEFKMGHKAAETTRNISNAFGPETSNDCTVQWWFESFAKKMRSAVAGHQKLTATDWED